MNVTIRNPPMTRLGSVAAWLLITTAIVAVSGCGDQKQQADGLVRAAIEHSKADRHTDAVQLLGRAIALDPGLAEAFYLRGSCFTKLHQSPQAVEEFSAATRLKPEWDEAWCALGIAQLTAGETEQGIESLSKALNLNPEMVSAWEARARGYQNLHLTEDELSDIEGLLLIDPVNCEALLRRGTLLSETDPVQATEDFSKVISRDRTNATAWMQRGLCYSRSGDTDRALADLNLACRLKPDDFHPWLERGRILSSLNRLDDAISDLSKAVELAPNDSDVREALARTDIVRDRSEEARKPVAGQPAEENTLSTLLTETTKISPAAVPEEANSTAEALVHADPIPVVEPGNVDAPQIRSALLAKSDRRKEAIEDQTRLISSGVGVKATAAAQSVLNRGRLHLDGKEWTAATLEFSKYLEEYPDDVEALALRARAWLAQDQASHAISDLTLALLKKPDAADLYTLRAESFDQFNEPTAALADLQKAASLQPTRLDVHQKLAERLFQDRQFAKCAKTLDALAASNAGQMSAEQRLLRGRARLADGNLNGAHEDACTLAAEESSSSGSVKPEDVVLLQSMIALRRHDDVESLRLVRLIPEETFTPDVLLLYGQTLARQNQPDEAIRIFSNLLKSDPSNTGALLARATVFVDTADWQAASNDAGLVLHNQPDDPRALQIKGTSLFQNDRFREALETLEHPALLSRETSDSRWMRIQCCDELELTFRELEELNALLGIAPTHEPARLLRAELLEKLGHFDDAIADLSAVLQHDPVHLVALTKRGLLNQRRGNGDAAVVDFTKAIELSPHEAELFYRRGMARHSTGQNDDARQDLDHALELNPDLADAWYVIGNIEAGRGQSDVAVAAFAKAVEIKPEHAAAWYNRGNLLFSQSKMQQAIDCWTIAITIQPELFRAYNNRAAAYDRLNQDTEALADYKKTVELNPGFARAWDSLAWLLATSDNKKVRDPQRAVSFATKACELSEFKDWSCLNTLATCHAENQEFDAALKWAKQARAIAPEADRKELDQLVAAYESRLKSKRMSVKPAGSVR